MEMLKWSAQVREFHLYIPCHCTKVLCSAILGNWVMNRKNIGHMLLFISKLSVVVSFGCVASNIPCFL